MKVYKTGGFNKNRLIEELECQKHTDKTLTIDGNRRDWVSRWERYHKSYAEAKAHLLSECKNSIANLNNRLDEQQSFLITIQNLPDHA